MDVICSDDLDEFGRDLNDPITELEQDIVHMLFESYGSNVDNPTRGIGLEDALSGPTDAGLKHRIESKLTDDPRIDAARVVLTSVDSQAGSVVQIHLDIQSDQGVLGITLQFDGGGNVVRVPS